MALRRCCSISDFHRHNKSFVANGVCRSRNASIIPEPLLLAALHEDEVRAAQEKIAGGGIRAIAICFLNSYLNGEHERRDGRNSAAVLSRMSTSIFLATSCPKSASSSASAQP